MPSFEGIFCLRYANPQEELVRGLSGILNPLNHHSVKSSFIQSLSQSVFILLLDIENVRRQVH